MLNVPCDIRKSPVIVPVPVCAVTVMFGLFIQSPAVAVTLHPTAVRRGPE